MRVLYSPTKVTALSPDAEWRLPSKRVYKDIPLAGYGCKKPLKSPRVSSRTSCSIHIYFPTSKPSKTKQPPFPQILECAELNSALFWCLYLLDRKSVV